MAGLFLALNNWQIKYTAQIMLEPLPALTSLLAVMCYIQSRRTRPFWLAASAIMLGITAAGKYVYCIAGLAILADWLLHNRSARPGQAYANRSAGAARILLWGLAAVLVFFAANPRLWADPFGRLWESIHYHFDYAASDYVSNAGYPVWQPITWLFISPPWHPGVFWVSLEFFYAVFAVFGLMRLWRKQRVMALWFGMALIFLLAWSTKWPQYTLILTAPFSMAAAEGFRALIGEPWAAMRARRREQRRLEKLESEHKRRAAREKREREKAARRAGARQLRLALPWLLPGMVGLAVITLFPLIYQLAMALTDFNGSSIFDGMQGGVWREVWKGLSGQVKPLYSGFSVQAAAGDRTVHYTGIGQLRDVFSIFSRDLFVFDLIWTLLSVGLQLAVGVAAALLLNKRRLAFKGWWGAVFILPWAIPEFVGALIWSQVFDPDFGWAATVASLSRLGVNAGAWQQNSLVLLIYLLIVGVWYGFPLMYLGAAAGLNSISREVKEAAALDGAGGWCLFRHITWPLLFPLLAPVIILRMIHAFNQFYLFFMLRLEYPTSTLSVISFNIFNYAQNYALSAAINVFTLVLLLVLLIVFSRTSKAAEGVTYV
ncbi:MAG: sugar ABC transporter permease [Anaerolineaceae bacterium]